MSTKLQPAEFGAAADTRSAARRAFDEVDRDPNSTLTDRVLAANANGLIVECGEDGTIIAVTEKPGWPDNAL